MNITVTKNQVSVNTDYILNDKEYNVNQCYFSFSDEYTDDLVKKAIFVQGTSTIEMSIINNQCQIPAEVLNNGQFELRVYAYEVDGDELVLRYSPSYATAYVRTGSYIENAESPEEITPTQFEQYMQAMNDGLNEVANVNIDAEQLDNGMSVTITNRYGEDKTVYAYNGEKGETGATPNIQIGTVVTGDHSEVTRTGTNENPIFNFVLEKGETGETGATGNGIASFEKTSTSGLVDTYTITFTNGTTSILNVTNGKGIVSIDLTSTEDNIDTYTITYNDNTTSTFTVTNSTVTDQEFETLEAEVNKYKTLSLLLPKVEGEGSSVTLNNTVEGVTMDITPEGATSQDGTPSPDTPIPIKVVTGDNSIVITGKNLFDKNTVVNGYRLGSAGDLYRDNNYSTSDYIKVNYSTNYVFNELNASEAIVEYDENKTFIKRYMGNRVKNITTTSNTAYVRVAVYKSNLSIFQLEQGSTATDYVPYQQQTYPISLGSIELAEIDNYQDYIYGSPNNWYKKSLIGKVVLDGSENYQSAGSNDNYWEYRRLALISGGTNQAVNSITTHFNQTDYSRIVVTGGGAIYLRFPKSAGIDISNTTLMKNWTTSNNVTFYYVLATSTSEPITDTTLIEQLNNLYNATSQDGTTYIICSSASDDNETLQVKVNAYKDISAILNPVVESGE